MDSLESYKMVISQLIAKQITILGPDITLLKVRKVEGLQVDDSGSVLSISGDPSAVMKQLINQFVELSGLIVKQTMESIMASGGGQTAATATQMMHEAHTNGTPTQSVAPTGPPVYNEEMVTTINSALSELKL